MKSGKYWFAFAATIPLAISACANTPTTPTAANRPGNAVGDRSTQAAPQIDQVLPNLPQQLTPEEAQKVLVNLPSDQLKGSLNLGNERKTQIVGLGGLGYYPYGNYYYPYAYSAYNNCYCPYSYNYGANYAYPYYYNYGNYYYPYASYYPYSYWPFFGGFGFNTTRRRFFGTRGRFFGRRGISGRRFGGRIGGRIGGRGGRR